MGILDRLVEVSEGKEGRRMRLFLEARRKGRESTEKIPRKRRIARNGEE